MFKQFIAISLLLALSFLHTADAIKCYQCRSLSEPGCSAEKIDASSNIRQVDCDNAIRPSVGETVLAITQCMKATAKDKAGSMIIRDCHFAVANQKPGECLVEHNLTVEKCHICKGDLCNASSVGRIIAMGVFAIIAVAAVNIAL